MSEKSMLEGVKNYLMRRQNVQKTLGLASNIFIYLLSNTASCVGCLGSDLILEAYCRDNFACLALKLGTRSPSRRSKWSKTSPKSLVVYRIQHLQVRLTSG